MKKTFFIILSFLFTLTAVNVSASDERITLSAVDAILFGLDMRLENDGNIGYWTANEKAGWNVEEIAEGSYKVLLEYARPKTENDESITITVSTMSSVFSVEIPATGDWEVYQTVELGEIGIDASVKRLILGNENLRETYFINLKNVYLIPVSDEPVKVNGTVMLPADRAMLDGDDMELENTLQGSPNIRYWYPGSSASWDIQVELPGIYKIVLNYSRDQTEFSLPGLIKTKNETLSFSLAHTGGWDNYAELEIGEIMLSAEDSLLTVTGGDGLKTDFMNLRKVTLEPAAGFAKNETESAANTDKTSTPTEFEHASPPDSGNTPDIGTEVFILSFAALLFIFTIIKYAKSKSTFKK